MDEKDYRYVLAIAQCKSFTRAAELLYTSQPALSRHIGLLEKKIGHPLFRRESHTLELTRVGERFCHYANIILEQERAFLGEVQGGISSDTVIKIGVPPLSGDYILARVMPQMIKKYPQIHFEPISSFTSELYQRLLARQIDVYIGTSAGSDPSICAEFLFYEPVYLAGSRAHPVLADYHAAQVDLEHPILFADIMRRMKDVPLICCNPLMPIHRLVEDALKERGFSPARKIKAPSLQLALDLTAQGVGFTAIMRCQLKYGNPNTVQEVYPISLGRCELPIYIVYNSFFRRSIPELEFVIREVREIYSSNPEI